MPCAGLVAVGHPEWTHVRVKSQGTPKWPDLSSVFLGQISALSVCLSRRCCGACHCSTPAPLHSPAGAPSRAHLPGAPPCTEVRTGKERRESRCEQV